MGQAMERPARPPVYPHPKHRTTGNRLAHGTESTSRTPQAKCLELHEEHPSITRMSPTRLKVWMTELAMLILWHRLGMTPQIFAKPIGTFLASHAEPTRPTFTSHRDIHTLVAVDGMPISLGLHFKGCCKIC